MQDTHTVRAISERGKTERKMRRKISGWGGEGRGGERRREEVTQSVTLLRNRIALQSFDGVADLNP